MDFLKKQLDTIQQNLSGLNATQKMLTGALVAIMVMTMVFWSRYAGTAEMEPVLNQTLSEDDLARMSASLDARGITNKVTGGKLLVAADRKMQALAELGYQQLLPRSSKSGFDEMFSKLNAFSSPQDRDAAFNRGREMTLAQIISGFPNVASADVMIDATTSRSLSRGDVTPSATINIRTRGGQPEKKLARAAADLVIGAVSTMNPAKIKVIIDGLAHPIPTADADFGMDGGSIMEKQQGWEAAIAQKIQNQLDYFGAVRATVYGELNTVQQDKRTVTYDQKTSLIQPESTKTRSVENNSNQAGGGDTGAVPNMGATLGGSTGGTNVTSTDNTEETKMAILPGKVETNEKKQAGDFTVRSVSVRLPRGYFFAVLRGRTGKDPSPTEVDAAIDAALPKLRTEVSNCIGVRKLDDIFVDTYDEIAPLSNSPAVAGIAGSTGGITAIVGGWGKELGVGVLAIVSLFMVSTMVRKSAPAPLVIQTPEKPAPSSLMGGEEVAGLASEGGPALAGMELDDDTIQTQQILDQVQQMVGENPDAAANLVKRWLNRT